MVCAEQTIEEQKIKFDFYGEMEGHICGLLIYPTLLNFALKSYKLLLFLQLLPKNFFDSMSPSPLRSIIRIFGFIDQLTNFMICSTKENQKSNPENHLAKEYRIL